MENRQEGFEVAETVIFLSGSFVSEKRTMEVKNMSDFKVHSEEYNLDDLKKTARRVLKAAAPLFKGKTYIFVLDTLEIAKTIIEKECLFTLPSLTEKNNL
jgi:GTP cyclohydrolase I